MDTDWQLKLIVLLILFILSAFFSGSEIALFSLNRSKIKNQFNEHPVLCGYLEYLLLYPRRLLVTILIGNTIVNVAIAIFSVSLVLARHDGLTFASTIGIPQELAIALQIIIITILIIIFGELIPKVWAAKNPISFSKTIVFPIYWISVLIYPVSQLISEIINYLINKVNYDKTKSAISPEDISNLAAMTRKAGSIIKREEGLIKGIVSFKSVQTQEVMTPRVDITAVSLNTKFDDILEIITTSGHSRLPLYREDIDDIVGFIYAKDLLPYIKDKEFEEKFSLNKISRKAMFVPETKLISVLMKEFQEKKIHLAVVVDEYGGTSGVISLEDILEEIIGEIRDEYDKEENPITKIDNNNFIVLGILQIDDLNELLNEDFESEDHAYETIGGMIFNFSGKIPEEGYSFRLKGYTFKVIEIFEKRIIRVKITKLSKNINEE
ncbi:MAG: HlyC/CorC family transporter [Bacteroidetes bacterium]|nr:HlyC/CorC family transporter [Bacteroidota bacterium]